MTDERRDGPGRADGERAEPARQAERPMPTDGSGADAIGAVRQALARLARASAEAGAHERPARGEPGAGESATRAEVRATLAGYVTRLRAEGAPPQRMVVLVKDAVRDATSGTLNGADVTALTADVVRWSIEAYYGD